MRLAHLTTALSVWMVAIAGMPPANAAGLAHEQAALEATLDAVMQAVTAGDEQALLLRLREAAVDPQLSALERDQLLMGMISDLRGMPPGSIGPDTFTYLTDYPPQATMPHEESPLVPVPVHNIRAAASGLRNAWQRVESAYAGALLLTMDPAALVQAYGLHDEWPVRQGLLMALDSASHGQLEMISFLALQHIGHTPELAHLAGEAALRLGDARALEQLLRTGRGSTITSILRQAPGRLEPDQIGRLLDTAIAEAPPDIAAVAIAELSPALLGQADHADRLFSLLDHEKLGATAALTLASNPSDATIVRLGEITRKAGHSSLSANRARLALELMRMGTDGGIQP